MGSLFLSDFESDFLEVLEPLVAPDREDVLIKVVKLSIIAASDHSKHEGIRSVVLDDVILETDRDVELLDGSRK